MRDFYRFLTVKVSLFLFLRRYIYGNHSGKRPGHHLANAADVVHRRRTHLPGHPQKHGTGLAAAHGLRGHSGEPALLRGRHPGSGSRPSGRAVSGGHRKRIVPAAAVHRHRRHDRFWTLTGRPEAADLRGRRPGGHFPDADSGLGPGIFHPGSGVHCGHCRSRRADIHLRGQLLFLQISGGHHCSGLLLHGPGPHPPAPGDSADDHEERAENIKTYKEINFFDGIAYAEDKYPNLIFAKSSEVYTIEGMKVLVIGGAYSIDKNMRLVYDYPWFKSEQLTKEEMNNIYEKVNNKHFDIVLSHTCPYKYIPREMFLPFVDQNKVDNSMELFLDKIEENISYDKWYCGHYHTEKEIDKIEFMYERIKKFKK